MRTRQALKFRKIKCIEQNYKCYWCKCTIYLYMDKEPKAVTSLIVPECRGGAVDLSNVVATCKACNQMKRRELNEVYKLL